MPGKGISRFMPPGQSRYLQPLVIMRVNSQPNFPSRGLRQLELNNLTMPLAHRWPGEFKAARNRTNALAANQMPVPNFGNYIHR